VPEYPTYVSLFLSFVGVSEKQEALYKKKVSSLPYGPLQLSLYSFSFEKFRKGSRKPLGRAERPDRLFLFWPDMKPFEGCL